LCNFRAKNAQSLHYFRAKMAQTLRVFRTKITQFSHEKRANFAKRSQIINDDLVMVEATKTRILMCKPIAIGCCILEFAKLVMYQFYYDSLLPKFGDRLRLCFTDTDSLICHIESENLDGRLRDIANEWLDTSNFDQEHPHYSTTNQCKLGKFKSEIGSTLPLEFVGLRSKMYSHT